MKICKYYFLILAINLAHKKETKPSKQLPRNCVKMKKKNQNLNASFPNSKDRLVKKYQQTNKLVRVL
jgi:hypothetical protein